jgi:hypothetical protein
MAFEGEQSPGGGSAGTILTRKTGPLANWIWMALLLLVAVVYAMWRRNKAAANANTDDTADSTISSDMNTTPPPVFILPQNPQPTVPVNVTVNNPSTPPPAPPVGTKPPSTTPPPAPGPPPKPTAPQYVAVSVGKYTSKNPPWNSTLWGIAKQYGYGAAGNNYAAILNDPRNAALKKKIGGDPRKLPAGAVVYVRKR